MDLDAQVSALDPAVLTGPVQCVLGSATAAIETWDHDLLYGGMLVSPHGGCR